MLSQLNDIYHAIIKNPQVESYQTILNHLKVSWQVGDEDLAKVPQKGAVVIVANHPFGGVEAMVLLSILRWIRPDVKVSANFLLKRIPNSDRTFIFADPYKTQESRERNIKTLQETFNWLNQDHMLVIFPACSVSRFQVSQGKITDPPWRPSIAGMIRRTKATVVPIYFDGMNTLFFGALGILHPRLRKFLLPREIMHQTGKTFNLKIDRPICYDDLLAQKLQSDLEIINYLRRRTYDLAHKK